jgi:hypothetical protein
VATAAASLKEIPGVRDVQPVKFYEQPEVAAAHAMGAVILPELLYAINMTGAFDAHVQGDIGSTAS